MKANQSFFIKEYNEICYNKEKNKKMLILVDKVQSQIGGMQPKFTV